MECKSSKGKEEGNTKAVNGSSVLNVKSKFVGNSDILLQKKDLNCMLM